MDSKSIIAAVAKVGRWQDRIEMATILIDVNKNVKFDGSDVVDLLQVIMPAKKGEKNETVDAPVEGQESIS